MFRYIYNPEKGAVRRGLYCVWVPVREGNRDRLISIWIDPAMRAFETQGELQAGNPAQEHALATDSDVQPIEDDDGQCRLAA